MKMKLKKREGVADGRRERTVRDGGEFSTVQLTKGSAQGSRSYVLRKKVFISLTLVLKSTRDFDRTLLSYLLEGKSTLLSGISSSLQTRGGRGVHRK